MSEILDFKKKVLVSQAEIFQNIQNASVDGDFLMRAIVRDSDTVKGNFPLSFIEFCVKCVDKITDEVYENNIKTNILFQDNFIDLWQKIDKRNKKKRPEVGDLVMFNYVKHGKLLTSGQIGIISKVNRDLSFETIEGAVISQFEDEPLNAQKAGIKTRKRTGKGTSKMKILGFFSPWLDRA